MKSLLLRWAARPYLAIYDAAMRLGPKWGAVALGYGPVVVAILAFVFKAPLLDRVMDPDSATVAIFLIFALTGPVMHVGTRIVTERLFRARNGHWPASVDPRFDRSGPASPTMLWVETLKDWARDG